MNVETIFCIILRTSEVGAKCWNRVLKVLSTCTGLWSSFVERVGQYGLKFVGIAIDWAQAPTEIYSHICRIGQLFASSLHIALAANVTEVGICWCIFHPLKCYEYGFER